MNRLSDWSANPSWEQILDDGRCLVDSVILPDLNVLQKRAREIANGTLTHERFGSLAEQTECGEWWRAVQEYPGHIDLRGKLGLAGRGFQYRISFSEAGDPNSHGHSGPYMAPQFAFAWMIAVAEDHHERIMENLALETGAGLS